MAVSRKGRQNVQCRCRAVGRACSEHLAREFGTIQVVIFGPHDGQRRIAALRQRDGGCVEGSRRSPCYIAKECVVQSRVPLVIIINVNRPGRSGRTT